MRNCLSRALACACFVALVVIVKHAETAGAVLRHKVDWQSLRGGVSKFEPTILCDIRSWDYALFPGHFDMVWASPVCTEYSRALTMRPRRLEEGDALLRALEIMEHFDPLMWVIENPATGLRRPARSWSAYPGWTSPTASTGLRTGSRPDCGPTCEPRAMQEWQPVRRVGGREASEGRSRGPRLMGGQRERVRGQSRELLCGIPAALCEETARAATAALADRLPG